MICPHEDGVKTVTRPGTSNPTALFVFLEGLRLFAESDILLDLRLAFPGEEINDRFRDGPGHHVGKDCSIQADIQFFRQKRHGFKFGVAFAFLYLNNRADTHVEPFS